MKFKRLLIILMLLTGLVFSIIILIKSSVVKDLNSSASSLAVITAIIGAWTALTITWNQEDTLLPIVELKFDLESRYGLILLVIENMGKSTAFDISIQWTIPIRDSNEKIITFPTLIKSKDIQFYSLLPNERASILVDEESQFYERNKDSDLNYHGHIKYKTSQKSILTEKRDIYLNLDHYRKSISYSAEASRTHFELQKIPGILNEIKKVLDKVNKSLESN